MKDPEYAALQREVRDAERRAQDARLRLWEKGRPECWRRLAIVFAALGLGYATALMIQLFLDGLDFSKSYDFGFSWQALFGIVVGPGVLFFLRFSPQLRLFMRHFDWELVLGFVAGLVLTLLFLVPRI